MRAVLLLMRYWIILRPVMFRNGMVYCHHCWEDVPADTGCSRWSVLNGISRAVGRFLPKPDLLLVLEPRSKSRPARESGIGRDPCPDGPESGRPWDLVLPPADSIDPPQSPSQVAAEAVTCVLEHLARRTARRHPHLAGNALPSSR